MSAICSDNSTECLLRILIETTANQTSPWEPRSFGFTVAIGVAAFLISFVAIFQGLLAAGPGRIKASSNAIGDFSKLKKGKLSWIEFAWRTTAYVPFVNYDDLREGLKRQSPRVPHGTNFPFSAGNITTGATWLQLFKSVGLNDEVEKIFEHVLQPCATDHLPADIQAPPVSVSLQCLAVLAAIADPTTTFEPATRFITIRGRISQFSFREHPVLGTIGGYERYPTKVPEEHSNVFDVYHKGPTSRIDQYLAAARNFVVARMEHRQETLEEVIERKRPALAMTPFASLGRCTSLALDLARGRLQLCYGVYKDTGKDYDIEFIDPSFNPLACALIRWHGRDFRPGWLRHSVQPYARAIALMAAQTDYEVRPFPWERCGFDSVVNFLHETFVELFDTLETFKKRLEPAVAQMDIGKEHKHRDPEHDLLFECRGSWITPYEPGLDMPGYFTDDFLKYLHDLCKTFWDEFSSTQNATTSKPELKDETRMWMGHGINIWWALKHVDILLRKNRVLATITLDEFTYKMIAQDAEREKQAGITRTPSHISLSPSIHSSTSESARQMSLHSASGTDAVPETVANRQGPQDPPIAPEIVPVSSGSNVTDQGQTPTVPKPAAAPKFGVLEASEEEYLLHLLAVRAVLFASLLRQGTDTSVLFEPGFRDSIVKII